MSDTSSTKTAADKLREKIGITETYTMPAPQTLTPPEPEPIVETIGLPPTPHMAEPETTDLLMTDITVDEMEAGKQASTQYAKRRQAELDYGKNFLARRSNKITGAKTP